MLLDLKDSETITDWIAMNFYKNRSPTIVRYQENWYSFYENRWGLVGDEDVMAFISRKLDEMPCIDRKGNSFSSSHENVSKLFNNMKKHESIVIISDRELPVKFNYDTELWYSVPTGLNLMSTQGLIDLEKFSITKMSGLFDLNAVDWAPTDNDTATEWLKFIDSLCLTAEQVSFLQEMFGYILSGDTSLQCAFLLVGPKRAGKGTIGHVLEHLIGKGNCCNPSLSDFGSTFGLQAFVGKKLALFGDGHTSSRAESTKAVEDILKISSGDTITIQRKYKSGLTTKIKARIIMLANELPTLTDTSDAVYSRFHILQLHKQFYGSEDRALLSRLLSELPGIARWAMAGYDKLNQSKAFTDVSTRLRRSWHSNADPYVAFVDDCLALEPDNELLNSDLYIKYCSWCENNGQRQSSKQYLMKKISVIFQGEIVEFNRKSIKGLRANATQF